MHAPRPPRRPPRPRPCASRLSWAALSGHVFTQSVADALGRSGCPACRLLRGEERRYWFYFIYEGFQDPAADASLRASAGFCRRHRAQLAQRRDVFAAASIALASVEGALARLEPGRGGLRRRRVAPSGAGCQLCASLAHVERAALDTLGELLLDPARAEAYRRAPGLCFDHAGLAVERRIAAWEIVRDGARAALGEHRERLQALMRTFDHRSAGADAELSAEPGRAQRSLGGDPGRIG